jgi:hypothetical protein
MSFALPLVSLVNTLAYATFLTAVTAQVPDQEITALFELYHSTNGASWGWKNEFTNGPKWNFTKDDDGYFVEDPCSSGWQGLVCSRAPWWCSSQTCHITELNLPDYKLAGSIPSEIGNLVVLDTLGLDYNALTGSIPSEIGNLVVLDTLDLN